MAKWCAERNVPIWAYCLVPTEATRDGSASVRLGACSTRTQMFGVPRKPLKACVQSPACERLPGTSPNSGCDRR
jgi:hypothetical protein